MVISTKVNVDNCERPRVEDTKRREVFSPVQHTSSRSVSPRHRSVFKALSNIRRAGPCHLDIEVFSPVQHTSSRSVSPRHRSSVVKAQHV